MSIAIAESRFDRVAFVTQFMHEWRIQWRRPFTWVCALLYFAIAFGDTVQIGLDGVSLLWVNGASTILDRSVILSILGVLAAAGIVGESMSRDRGEAVESLILSTGASRATLGGARFLACYFVVVLTTMLFIPGMLLGAMVPGIPTELIGPVELSHYTKAFLLFILPNAFIMSALLYAVSVITRSQAAAFGAALMLIALFVGAVMLLGRDAYRHDVLPVFAMLDPFGAIASAEFAMGWTVQQANVLFVPFDGLLQSNRLLWCGIGLLTAIAATRLMSLDSHTRLLAGSKSRSRRKNALLTKLRSNAGELLSLLMWELTQLWRSPVRTLSFLFAAFTIWWVAGSASNSQYSLPSTDLLTHNTNYYFDKIMVLIIAWLAGELLWREQRQGVSALIDSQPVSAANRLLAKTIALIIIVLAFWSISIIVNIAYQLTHGVYDIELWLHLVDTFVVKAPYTIWLAILAICLQVIIRHRYIAMGVFAAFWTSSVLLDAMGLYHPLYRFGETPFFWYSNMDGYGHFMGPHLAFVAYWAVSCTVLWLLTLTQYAPGEHHRSRLSLLKQAMNHNRIKPVLGAAVIAWVLSFTVLYKLTAIDHPWPLPNPDALKAEVERDLRDDWRTRPQPKIVESRARIDLYPSTRSATIQGEYIIANNSEHTIEQVLVMREPSLAMFEAGFPTLPGSHRLQRHPTLGYEIWQLEQALPPGAEIPFSFRANIEPSRGITAHAENDGVPQVHGAELIGNGSSFLSLQLLPIIGYSDHVEHKPKRKRQHYGHSDDWTPPPRAFGLQQPHATGTAGWLRRIEATITTEQDQVPLHSGELVELSHENGRAVAHYVLEGPVRVWTQIISGRLQRYDVKRPGLPTVEVYFHPAHDSNIELIGNTFADALAYFQNTYGPAPYQTLRFAEQSLHYDSMGSRQGLAYATEVLGWKTDLDVSGGKDILKLAGHLVGLSWFGDQIIPANVPGAKVLHAGLPAWSGTLFLNRQLSDNAARQWRKQRMSELFQARMKMSDGDAAFDQELKDSTMVQYKGALLMLALADIAGIENVEAAMASFLTEWKYAGPPYPTIEHLIQHFLQHIPEVHHAFIEDIFRHIVSWRLSVEQATCERKGDNWLVRATINAEQLRYDASGESVPEASTPPITTALLVNRDGTPEIIQSRSEYLAKGETIIEWTVDTRPDSISIDPEVLLPDANLFDNSRELHCPH